MSIIDGTALILYQICIGFLPRYYASILSRQSYTSYQFANLLVLWQVRFFVKQKPVIMIAAANQGNIRGL